MNKIVVSLSCVLLLSFVAVTWSSEADDLRAKAKAVQHEADLLSKKGQNEEADKLYRAAKELLQQAEKHDPKAQKHDPKGGKNDPKSPKGASSDTDELHQLLKAIAEKEKALKESGNKEGLAELQKHRAAIEHKLGERKQLDKTQAGSKPGAKPSEKHDGKPSPELPEELQDAARRIKHVHIAVENLRAAGMKDIAEELANRAEQMEKELHQAHERHAQAQAKQAKARQDDDDREDKDSETNQLRREVQRLRAELEELRQDRKKRVSDDD